MKRILAVLLCCITVMGATFSMNGAASHKSNPRPQPQHLKVMPDKNRKEREALNNRIDPKAGISFPGVSGAFSSSPLKNTTREDEPFSFYGYMVYSSVDYYLGLYEIFPGEEYGLFFEDPGWEALGFDLVPYNGWYSDGKLNGISLYWYDPYTPGAYFSYSLDFETGEVLAYEEYYDWFTYEYLFDVCTLNPDDDRIYGYALNSNGSSWKYYWASAPADDPTKITVIREADYSENFISICYKADEQRFYGLTWNFDFVSIDPQGNLEYLFPAPIYQNARFYDLQSGLIWDEDDEVFYWNAQVYDLLYESLFSFLFSISPDGDFEMVEQYSYDQQFAFFVSKSNNINPEMPLPAVIEKLETQISSLSVTMMARMPETFGDGTPLPSPISYTALLNGETYTEGTAEPGSEVTVSYEVPEPGSYTFGIYVSANGHNSKITTEIGIVGIDTPKSPTNVELTPTVITWEAVTAGVNGGVINPEEVSYIVSLNGKTAGTVTGTSYTLDLYSEPELCKYTATVTALFSGIESAPAVSNTIVAGKPVTLPLEYAPTEEEFELMTVVNANSDSYVYDPGEITWTLTSHGLWSSGTEFKSYSMDDYVFLPPALFDCETHEYTLTFEAGRYIDWYPDEFLNVIYATSPTPNGVTEYIMKDFTPEVYLSETKWENWDQVSVTFSVPESGIYYLGFQCVSAPAQYGIYIRDITLSANGDAGVEGVKATDDEETIYNLNGMKVDRNKITNGIYIINGKKVVVRK